ncbi:MAG: diguanylate cyclase [Campylobacterota bacterium]
MNNKKNILVADTDLQLVAFLQERIKDKRFHFIIATSYDYVVDLLESVSFFAAIIDFEMQSDEKGKVVDYVLSKHIPTIATFDELSDKQYKEISQYPVIDYVIKNNLAGKEYLSELLQGLESFYHKEVLLCCNATYSPASESILQIFNSLLFKPIIKTSANEALTILQENQSIKIIYINETLQDESGLWLCREIKNRYPDRDLIIFGGAQINMDTQKFKKLRGAFFKSGVTDFFAESIDKERFNTHILSMTKNLKQKESLSSYIETVDRYVLISITNLKGVIVYASDAFCDISGYSKEEMIGKNHNIIRHPDMDASVFKELWATLKSEKPWKGEIKNRKKNGDHYWVSVSIEPVHNDKGDVIAYQSVRFDITDKKKVEELSITDRLTGIYNRRKFDEILHYEFTQRQRHEKGLALIMVDFDYFKKINDKFGHQTGDSVLVKTAELLQSSIRASDSVYRWGGEEFCIISPATDAEGALILAEKIHMAIADFDFGDVGQQTASLGLAIAQKDDTIFSFVNRVDEALYKAKSLGRNRIEMG